MKTQLSHSSAKHGTPPQIPGVRCDPPEFKLTRWLGNPLSILAGSMALTFAFNATAAGQTVTVIDEDFASSAGNFTEVAGGAWSVSGGRYVLTNPASGGSSGNGNISVHDTSVSGDFVLTTDALVTGTTSDWNDFSIIFGYQDANNYYYASFNENNDGATQGLFRLLSGTVTELDDFGAGNTISADTLYAITITRSGSNITIDLGATEVASVTDSTFTSGKVGYGTRNDSAEFDNLDVTIPDTQAPSVPTGLASSNVTSDSVDLDWNASTDNVAVTGYKVYTGGANPVSVTGTSTTISGLSASTSYTFTVSAVDGADNESSQSNGVGVTTSSSSSGEISEDFSASAANFTEVAGGTWSVSGGRYVLTNPASSGLSGNGNISVHNTSISGDFVLTTDALVTGTTSDWNDFSIIFGYQDANNYYFASFNESNDSSTQGLFRVLTGTTTELTDFGAGNTITADTLYSINITRSGSNIVVKLNSTPVGNASDSTFTSGKVGYGTRNDGGEFDNLEVEETDPDTEAPSTPTGLTSSNVTSSTADLDWNASTDNVGVSGYYIYTDGANPTSSATNSVTVTGLSPSTTYDFTVSAYDAAMNESSESSAEEVTTNASSGGGSGFPTHPNQIGLSGVGITRTSLPAASTENFTSSHAGTTISNVYFSGTVSMQNGADNITFEKCWFKGGPYFTVRGYGAENVTFLDCDFGEHGASNYVDGGHLFNLEGTIIVKRCFFYNSADSNKLTQGSVNYYEQCWFQPVHLAGGHTDCLQGNLNVKAIFNCYQCTFELRTWEFSGSVAHSQEELSAGSITTANIESWGNACVQTSPCGTGGCSGPVSGCDYAFEECLLTGGNYIITAENQTGEFINNTLFRGSANPSTDLGLRDAGNMTVSGNVFHDNGAGYSGGAVGNGNATPIPNYAW